MEFEWDENKRARTLADRGLDFRDAWRFFDGRPVFTSPSVREGEARFLTVGRLEGHILAVVWIDRDGNRRVISMRRARRDEERAYRTLFG